MELKKMSIEIQQVAAGTLEQALLAQVDLTGINRTEQAEKVAEAVRVAFECLFKG